MELQVILAVVGILSLLSNVIGGMALFILRGIKRGQERLWERIDRHVDDPELHPDIDRLRRLERIANGRAT